MLDAFTALRAASMNGNLADMLAAWIVDHDINLLAGDGWSTYWASFWDETHPAEGEGEGEGDDGVDVDIEVDIDVGV